MKKLKPKNKTLVVVLTETQRVAIHNTIALKNQAVQKAAAPYDKQLSDVATEAVTAAGHDAKQNWRLSPDGKSLQTTPVVK